MCPPACPEATWFKSLIASYDRAILYYDIISFADNFKLQEEQRLFQRKLLDEEHALKRKGFFFALSFFSGACVICDDTPCRQTECSRPSTGRVPICGTGINIAEISQKILNLPAGLHVSYWQLLRSHERTKEIDHLHLCLGLILF
jgi:predicted metal-binding protein